METLLATDWTLEECHDNHVLFMDRSDYQAVMLERILNTPFLKTGTAFAQCGILPASWPGNYDKEIVSELGEWGKE
jgi:hypothetical protein